MTTEETIAACCEKPGDRIMQNARQKPQTIEPPALRFAKVTVYVQDIFQGIQASPNHVTIYFQILRA